MAFGLSGERRQGERRRGDRRRMPRSSADDECFAPLSEPPAAAPADAGPRSRFARRMLRDSQGPALPRVLRLYVIARASLGLALMVAPFAATLGGGHGSLPVMLVSLAYLVQAVAMWVLRKAEPEAGQDIDRLQPHQWFWTIGVDLVAFSALRLIDPVGQLNYSALLVLPLLLAGVLTRRTVALATCAAVVLVLLAGVWLTGRDWGDAVVPLSQAGLAGAGMFVITFLASELAQRLTGEELSARSNLALARQQTQLNRLVIEEMTEGVLVIDSRGQVLAVNPAAQALLGQARAAGAPHQMAAPPALLAVGIAPLQRALQRAYQIGAWPDDAREVDIALPSGERRRLQVRARFTRRAGVGSDGDTVEDICVLFLDDLRAVQARVRQEKLAAMGRMSAGIAHEIRNPLAAITQANALLTEDVLMPPQRRLARIVADNAERLKRIVDDVLTVAAAPSPHTAVLDLGSAVQQVCDEWQRTVPNEVQAQRRLELNVASEPLPVLFDAEHLRRVLVNLLDNAARHASRGDGAVRVSVGAETSGLAALSVASDGEPIPPETERHLFEPFFSTRSRGSGLGLYICRELCAHHGATIDYLPAPPVARHRNVFRVVIRRAGSAA